jgi:ClpP class serine protease
VRLYAMEAGFLSRLRADREEIFVVARSLGSAEEMRQARADLMASIKGSIFLAPKAGDDLSKLYAVDDEGRAHIAIMGELTPQAETDACGAYTAQALTEYGYIEAASRAASADKKVSSVVFDVNSPGGYVDGVDQAAQAMAAITKPTEARVHGMAASAAYWLASQTDRIVAMSPAVQIGSIGVAAEEYDDDEYLAKKGIAHRVYTSTDAPDKHPDMKTDEGKAKLVSRLDALHRVFVSRVAEGRNVSPDKVNKDFGRGGVLIASAAKAAGMIDHIEGMIIARPRQTMDKPGVAGSAQAHGNASAANLKSKEVRHMDLNKLKAEFPEESAALVAEGMKAEQSRREKIVALKGANADGDKAVEDAIASGKSFDECFPAIQGAINRGKGANANGENAPDLPTKKQKTASGTLGLTDEDRQAAKMVGMTEEEYIKYSSKEEK